MSLGNKDIRIGVYGWRIIGGKIGSKSRKMGVFRSVFGGAR